jgi:hypothetical protein
MTHVDSHRVAPSAWLADRGVLLHVGPPKTGTTALQTALAAAAPDLEPLGVTYPVRPPTTQHGRAAAALLQRKLAGSAQVQPMESWDRLVRRAARRSNRFVISSELFADLDAAHTAQAVAELGRADLHVLITLRPLEVILSSTWQQDIKGGRADEFDRWLHERLDEPGAGAFWIRHAHDRLVERWTAALGPNRVCVLLVDSRRPQALLRDAELLIGIPQGTLVPTAVNRSMTRPEAELLVEFMARHGRERDRELFQRLIRLGGFRALVENRTPPENEPRIMTPAWAVRRAREIYAPMADRILRSGARIVGEPSLLTPTAEPENPCSSDGVDIGLSTSGNVSIDAAVELALGIYRAAEREIALIRRTSASDD